MFWGAYFDHLKNRFVPQMAKSEESRFTSDETDMFNNNVRFNKQIIAWCERVKFETMTDSFL